MELYNVVKFLMSKYKGILAADESFPTIKKRLEAVNVESTDKTRNGYRELLFFTKGLEDYVSGIIMFDETLRSKTSNGHLFPQALKEKGIISGIKVDKGLVNLPGTNNEKVTQGLDGLHDRLKEYYSLGARFAKWRAVISIGENTPTQRCIKANAHVLARYASISQKEGLVPIVEPEVLFDGEHNIDQCEKATLDTLSCLFYELYNQDVNIETIIIKTNMVTSGKNCPKQADIKEVAQRTIHCFKQVLPPALPGIAFLSGGQSAVLATQHLNEMNASDENLPWELSFSYGRALQEPALNTWKGREDYYIKAQDALFHRAKCNGLARCGEYKLEMEN